jgi:hypothetical protein
MPALKQCVALSTCTTFLARCDCALVCQHVCTYVCARACRRRWGAWHYIVPFTCATACLVYVSVSRQRWACGAVLHCVLIQAYVLLTWYVGVHAYIHTAMVVWDYIILVAHATACLVCMPLICRQRWSCGTACGAHFHELGICAGGALVTDANASLHQVCRLRMCLLWTLTCSTVVRMLTYRHKVCLYDIACVHESGTLISWTLVTASNANP